MASGPDAASIGSLVGTGAGAFFGGPMGAMVGGSAGGMLGSLFGGGMSDDAIEALKRAQRAIEAIPEPTVNDLKLALEPLVQQGILTPDAFSTILQEPSEFMKINIDQTARNAELTALSQMQDIAASGGRDAQFRAAMNDVTNQTNTQLRGQTEGILQNAAQRGALNSNMTTAAALANAYAGNANMANASVNAAAEAERRALDAIAGSASLGNQIRTQDFSEASQRAQAIDAINRYNAQNTQSQSNMNTQSRNVAQAQNLDLAQQVAQYNTDTRNDAAKYNAQVPQQVFQNKLAKAGAMAGLAMPTANLYQQGFQNKAATQGNLIGGMGQNLTNYYNNKNLTDALKRYQQPVGAAASGGSGGWMMSEGGPVPGEAPIPGDHPGNDTVHARLSPGEFVLSREEVQDPQKLAGALTELPAMQGVHPEDIRSVLEALTGMRNMWKGGKC